MSCLRLGGCVRGGITTRPTVAISQRPCSGAELLYSTRKCGSTFVCISGQYHSVDLYGG